MKYIHPEIAKFWENTGYEVGNPIGFYPNGRKDTDTELIWMALKRNVSARSIAFKSFNGHILYFFDGNKYAEQEALRIIKLAAFL